MKKSKKEKLAHDEEAVPQSKTSAVSLRSSVVLELDGSGEEGILPRDIIDFLIKANELRIFETGAKIRGSLWIAFDTDNAEVTICGDHIPSSSSDKDPFGYLVRAHTDCV
jgi:hypothetical protein